MNLKRTITSTLLALGVTVGALVVAAPAHAAGSKGVALTRGQALFPDEWIERSTSSGIVRLAMQTDGNLVLWLRNASTGATLKICWATKTSTGYKAYYQEDGNFVLYPRAGGALWASNTVGPNGSTVDMNSNGQLWAGVKPVTGNCKL
jgi:hypothetical protein